MGSTIAVSSPKRRKRAGAEPDINVTPLVDVVLVLLIIFMVIAPEMEHGERVELPAITTPDEGPKPKIDPVMVTVSANGNFFLEKEPIKDVAALVERLKTAHEAEPDRKIVLKGDASLPYLKLRTMMAEVQAAGLPGVSLSVTQKGGKGGGKGEATASAEGR